MTALAINQKTVISASKDGYPEHRWVVMLLTVKKDASRNSIYSSIEQRKLKFNNAAVFMVVLPAITKWLGYTKHKTAGAALRKAIEYDKKGFHYEIIDCYGNFYERDLNADGELVLAKIPNAKLDYTVKQEIIKTK